MGFSVNSEALAGLASAMDRRWHELEEGRGYLHRYARLSGPGLINRLLGQHDQIVAEIDGFLARAAEAYAGGYSVAVTEALVAYAHSDLRAARRNDHALPDPPVDGARPATADTMLSADVFADPIHPVDRYRVPIDHAGEWYLDFDLLSVVSPTSVAREAIWNLTRLAAGVGMIDHPIDVIEVAAQPLAGNWASFLACADVFDNIAAAVADSASCVESSVAATRLVWTGHAADRALVGLIGYAIGLRAAAPVLRQTAAVYRQVAATVKAECRILCSLITVAADLWLDQALAGLTLGLLVPFEMLTEATDVLKAIRTAGEIEPIVVHLGQALIELMEQGRVTAASAGVVQDEHPVPQIDVRTPMLPALASRQPMPV